jgi:hypothetical protein
MDDYKRPVSHSMNVGNPGGPYPNEGGLSDLDMTKICASLRGIKFSVQKDKYDDQPYVRIENFPGDSNGGCYQPIYNDLQAMDLVKSLRLDIEPHDDQWQVSVWKEEGSGRQYWSFDVDLNRAIVKCCVSLSRAHEPYDYRTDPLNQPENIR